MPETKREPLPCLYIPIQILGDKNLRMVCTGMKHQFTEIKVEKDWDRLVLKLDITADFVSADALPQIIAVTGSLTAWRD